MDDPKKRPGAMRVENSTPEEVEHIERANPLLPVAVSKSPFSPRTVQFAVSVITIFFMAVALFGVELPAPAAQLAQEAVINFSNSGWFGLIGWFVSSLGGFVWIVYTKIKEGKIRKWEDVAGDINLVLLAFSFVASLTTFLGIEIPESVWNDLALKLWEGDYLGVASIFLGKILNPLIRWIRARRTVAEAVQIQ